MVKKFLLLALAASSVLSSAFAADACTIAISPTQGTFTGNQIKPVVTRVVCGEDEVTKFTVSYGKNINAGADAGSVLVTVNGSSTPIEKTFKIAKRSIEVIIDDAQKEKGTDDPEFTWHIDDEENIEINADSLSNLKKSLLKTIKLSREQGEDIVSAGGDPRTYPITLADGVYDALSENYPNYSIDYTEGTFSITKTKVTVVAKSYGKKYGEADPKKFEYTISGNITSADYDKLGAITLTREEGENAGNYMINVSVKNKETADYIVDVVGGVLVIQPASATITVDDVSKIYGDATPEYTYKVSGLVKGDALKNVTVSCAKCPTSGPENAGEYDISATVKKGSNPNYNVTTIGGTLTVTPKPITVSVKSAEKTYGDSDPKYELDVDGLVSAKEQLELATISRAKGEDVGTYKVSVSFAEGSNPNYTLSVKAGTLTIVPKDVTLNVTDVSKKFGEKDPALTYTVDGIVSFDGVEDVLKDVNLTRAKGEDAGSYAITASVVAKSNPNYVITTTDGVFTIKPNDDKIVVTITGKVDTVVYDGKVKTVKGFDMECNNEAYSLDFVKYTGEAIATATDAGKTLMGISKDDFSNTSVNYPDVTFEVTDGYIVIKPRPVVVTAISDTITYGDETPSSFNWSADNLLGTDKLDNIHVSLTVNKSGLLDAGEYVIDFDQMKPTNPNYVVTEYVPGALTVNKKIVTVTVADASKVYGDPDPEKFDVETDGLLEGDELTGLIVAREAGEDVRPDDPYRISATLASDATVNPNYTIKVKQGYFTITPYMEHIVIGIIGDEIRMPYTGDTITVHTSFDVIMLPSFNEKPLSAEYAYSKEFVTYKGDSTVSGVNMYIYPMNLDATKFENISPNFGNVSFVFSSDGTLVIEDPRTSIGASKAIQKFGLSTMGRSIQVNASKVGDKFAVLDMQGRVVRQGIVPSASFNIPVTNAGVYMVRVGAVAQRIRVK